MYTAASNRDLRPHGQCYNPHSMPLQRFPLSDYRGGLNFRDGPFDLEPNESPDALNVTLTALVGQLQVRRGKQAAGNIFPGGRIDNMRSFNLPLLGAPFGVMASINGKIYTLQGNGSWALRFTGTAGTIWDFAQMQDASGVDWVWCSNGVDAPQKWAGGATTAAWAGLGTSKGGKRILVWKDKMVLAQESNNPAFRVMLSQFGDPEATTGAYDTVDIRASGDETSAVTELQILGDRLYAFKQRSTWVLTDPTTGNTTRIGEPGCFSRFQSDVCNNKIYFLNEQGVWSTQGIQVELESGQLGNFFPASGFQDPTQQQVNIDSLELARLMTTRDDYPRILMCLPMGSDAFNSRVLELIPNLNYRRVGGRRYILLPAYMLHDFHASCLCNDYFTTGAWTVIGGDDSGANKAYYYFLEGTTSDDGVEISAHWHSAWVGIQEHEPKERLRRINIQMSGELHIDVFKDFTDVPVRSFDVLDDDLWSGGTWSGGTWGPLPYRMERVRPETRGRYHAIKLSTILGKKPFSVNAIEFAVRGGKEH